MAGSFARHRIESMGLLLEGLEGVKQGVDVAVEYNDTRDTSEGKALMMASSGIECFGTMFREELKRLAENLDGLEARAGVTAETPERKLEAIAV